MKIKFVLLFVLSSLFAPSCSDSESLEPDNNDFEGNLIELVYHVSDPSVPVYIFSPGWESEGIKEFDISNISKLLVSENSTNKKKEVTPGKMYTFSSAGTHYVYVEFKDKVVIPDGAFCGVKKLKGVVIPNEITTIGYKSFYRCEDLEYAKIPSSIKIWGISSFDGCNNLKTLQLEKGLKVIGEQAFANCRTLEMFSFPESVTEIGKGAFMECIGFKGLLTIPSKLKKIEKTTFSGCEGLTSISIPNSVTTIGNGAFSRCEGLTEVHIPEKVVYLSGFNGCVNLKTVNIPNSVDTIGSSAFDDCRKLTEITIPNSVIFIESCAFRNSGLNSVVIPNSVKSIGKSAFWQSRIKEVTIGSGVGELQDQAFGYCLQLEKITSLPATAPTLGRNVFDTTSRSRVASEGVLYIPANSAGYKDWLQYLGNGWSMKYI